jgi:hypothetical protein
MYTRGYDVAAPAQFVFGWLVRHAPPEDGVLGRESGSEGRRSQARIERRSYPRRRLEKVTRWEVLPPDRVTFHDRVLQNGRLVVEGEERYRFLGGDGPGCIAEVTVYRKPIGWLSRFGFALAPEWSLRSRNHEAELFREIEHDFRAGRWADPRAEPPGEM